MGKKCVVLVSGGADSATVLGIVSKAGYDIYALSIDYGQRNAVELEVVKKLINSFFVKTHKILHIDLPEICNSSLTDHSIDVPSYSSTNLPKSTAIPNTYVPARNTIFLSCAMGYAESLGALDIFIGVHMEDSGNYPDCRKEYIETFEKMARIATLSEISIHTPLINMNKTQIIQTGIELNVPYNNTISCYNPTDGISCSKCHACLIRISAFKANNMDDPIRYIKQ